LVSSSRYWVRVRLEVGDIGLGLVRSRRYWVRVKVRLEVVDIEKLTWKPVSSCVAFCICMSCV